MVDFASPLWPIGRLERLFTAIEISGWHQTRQFAYGGRPPYGLVVAYPEGISTEPNPLSEYLRKRTFTNTPEPDVDEQVRGHFRPMFTACKGIMPAVCITTFVLKLAGR